MLIWDIPQGRFRKEMLVQGQVSALALSADGSNVLVGTLTEENKKDVFTVSHWDAAAGKQLRVLGKHKDPVFTLVFAPQKDRRSLPAGARSNSGTLPRAARRELTFDPKDEVFAATLLPDGKKILCAVNHNLRVLDLAQADLKKAAAGVLEFPGHQMWWSPSPSPPTARPPSPQAQRDHSLLGPRQGQTAARPQKERRRRPLLDFARPGRRRQNRLLRVERRQLRYRLAILSLWDAAAGKEVWSRPQLSRRRADPRARPASPDRRWLQRPGPVGTWQGDHRTHLGRPQAPVDTIRADAKGRLYAAGQDGYVHVWEKDQIVRSIPAHAEPIFAIALNPQETQLFTASGDKTVKVWDLATGKLHQTLTGHGGTVMARFSPKTASAAYTASSDRTVKEWDVKTGKALATLAGHSEASMLSA